LTANEPRLPGAVPFPLEFAERWRALGFWRGETIGAWFRDRAQRFGNRCAIVEGERCVSYRELDLRADAVARGWAALGMQPLDRVVLQLPNGSELLAVLLGSARAGVIPVMTLPAHRELELRAFCDGAGAVAAVLPDAHAGSGGPPLTAKLLASCPSLRRVLVAGREFDPEPTVTPLSVLTSAEGSLPTASFGAGEVALLQLSGGSTGMPKLIARTHDDYLYSVRASAELCALSQATRYLVALPMLHNFTLSSPGVLGVLDAGGTLVIASDARPETVLSLWERERITLTAAVPSLVRVWVDAHERQAHAGRFPELTLQVGGAKLDQALALRAIARFGCRLQQVFGMAEGLVNYTRLDADEATIVSTQGRPLSPADEIRVVDPEVPEGAPLPPGHVGELQTRGPYTIRGYYGQDLPDPAHFTADGFYRTGDLVRLTSAGDLVVEGRLGERIARGGEKIAPEEVENQLRAHPQVADVAVVGAADVYLGERSHAFVVLRRGEVSLGLAEARRFLRERGLAEFKLPDALHLLEELPRTKVGKTDRRALREGLLGERTNARQA
jgi:2,3-dihydroxybenzoate-AMP ligase